MTEWGTAKDEARGILIASAKIRETTITYGGLVRLITSISVETNDSRLFRLLDDVSIEENALGHGMLSVIVVHKHGDMLSGSGFFKLAEELGRDTSDHRMCWNQELQKVNDYWEGLG